LQAMIDEFDKDNDGRISLDEFMAIMKQTSLY
jgi:Ca2+-binding EF-hand superfamily protein